MRGVRVHERRCEHVRLCYGTEELCVCVLRQKSCAFVFWDRRVVLTTKKGVTNPKFRSGLGLDLSGRVGGQTRPTGLCFG